MLDAKYEVGIGGVKGATLVGRVAAVEESGRRWALVAFAAGERVPAGQLRGLGLHWGCAAKDGWGWEPPPRGWTSAPDASYEAGTADWRQMTSLLQLVMLSSFALQYYKHKHTHN